MLKSINFNGAIRPETDAFLNHENRGLRYGDALFETLRASADKIFFWEDHYLRLMASMRILRMEIPMAFTMEYLEKEIRKTLAANALIEGTARVRLTVFRNDGGRYLPATNTVSFCIETTAMASPFYVFDEGAYEIELFKDFYGNANMLATLKTNNRLLNVVGSVYAEENGYHNCLLLNQDKKVIEFLNGNVFMVNGSTLTTPPLSDGCINGILRKKLIATLNNLADYTLVEGSISPFDLQKADELFMTNSISGIRSVRKYRKKEYAYGVAQELIGTLNAAARLS